MSIHNDFLWCEKYRPKTVADTILPHNLKTTFQTFVDNGNVPNLLLSGGPGVGKTTIAKAMLNEIDADYIVINGSNEGRSIDVLRVEISNFASTVSFSGGRKYVILDEADYLNPNSTQPALRNFMEAMSSNCGFILTCNFKSKIIEPLWSRCSVVDFVIPAKEKAKMALEFYKTVLKILDAENVEYDKKVVATLVNSYFPDNRRILNELQRYSAAGRIDEGILSVQDSGNFAPLFKMMREKDFTSMRKWVGENNSIDSAVLYKTLYDNLASKVDGAAGIASAIVILAEYQYKEAFVANAEINRVACLATLMGDVAWK